MNIFQHITAFSAVIGSLAICAQAHANEKPALPPRVQSSGFVKIAVNNGYPKMEMRNPTTNELEGFDIDLANELAAELGLKTEWIDGAFEQMIPAITAGRVDMIMSGMSDLPERHAVVDFVDYMQTGTRLYALTSTDLKEPAQVCGKTVTLMQGTSFQKVVRAWSAKECVGKGREDVKIVLDANLGQQISNLKQKRADAAAQSMEAVDEVVAKNDETFKWVGEPIEVSLMGIAFKKADADLRDAFLWALRRKIEDGSYDRLIEKWDLKSSAYRKATVNLGEAK